MGLLQVAVVAYETLGDFPTYGAIMAIVINFQSFLHGVDPCHAHLLHTIVWSMPYQTAAASDS